jgi:hypothetical protein
VSGHCHDLSTGSFRAETLEPSHVGPATIHISGKKTSRSKDPIVEPRTRKTGCPRREPTPLDEPAGESAENVVESLWRSCEKGGGQTTAEPFEQENARIAERPRPEQLGHVRTRRTGGGRSE